MQEGIGNSFAVFLHNAHIIANSEGSDYPIR